MSISKLCVPLLMMVARLPGCVTLFGSYIVTATDADGNDLAQNVRMMADGTGIYTARNALCATYQGAVVHIDDSQTGQELDSDSPRRCKGAKR